MKKVEDLDQEYIVKLYNEGKTSYRIAESELEDINAASEIRELLHNKGIKLRKEGPKPTPQANIDEMIVMYNEGINSEDIAEHFKTNGTTVCRHLKNNGIKIRPGTENKRKLNINHDFFDAIDSQEKAYVLGLLYADGNVHSKQNNVKIALQLCDRDILDKISDFFYPENNVKIHKRHDGSGKSDTCINFYHPHIKEKLIELGCTPNKTFIIDFPKWLDENLYPHFIRGFFDGDGCLSISNPNRPVIDFTSNINMVTSLQKIFEDKFGITFYISGIRKDKKENTRYIQTRGFNTVPVIMNWLYKDSIIHMNRKHNIYLKMLKLLEKRNENNKVVDEIFEKEIEADIEFKNESKIEK